MNYVFHCVCDSASLTNEFAPYQASQTTHPRITSDHIFKYFYTYDEKGNPDEYTFPSDYTIKNEYKTGNGALQNVKEKQSGRIIYAPGSYNARGQMNHYAIANKSIYTRLEYDEYGLPTFCLINCYNPISLPK
ncbi:MAG: hypothetical protein RBS33_10875 [Lentimicrobium sp.]|jgi:hypothetical protein|nr:hypothetical protein [Lentimicrobium sp.]